MNEILGAVAVALVSGVVSGLISYGGISTKLDWHRKDIDDASNEAANAKDAAMTAQSTANTALSTANTALNMLNKRG